MTDVHSDSACMPLVMGNSVSLRDLIQWLTTLFTRRFSSLLNWNLSYWDSSLDLVLTRWQHRTSLLFFWQKEYPRYVFNFLDIVISLSLTLLPLIFHLMDKQLLFPYPFTMGSDLQTPYHPGHIQLAAIIDWMICCAVPSCSLVSYSFATMDSSLPGSSVHGDSPGKNTGVGCHALLQGIFSTWELNWDLLHFRQILYQLSYQGNPNIPHKIPLNPHTYCNEVDITITML